MKRIFKSVTAVIAVILLATSCKKEASKQISNDANSDEISQEVLAQIKEKGFETVVSLLFLNNKTVRTIRTNK